MSAPKRNTTQRGYGTQHQRLRAAWQARINREGTTCVRCGGRIPAGSRKWDLGHTADRTGYTGPEHVRCNRSEGASRGNKQRATPPPRVAQRDW